MFSNKEIQKGISLVVLMIMVVFVGIMVGGIHAFLGENIRLSSLEKDRARALYLAEAGLSDSYWELKYSEKLYGSPSQPYGQIDQQTVNFYDGTSGTYEVPEPTDSIVSTGTYNGIVRRLKVGIDYATSSRYCFFSASENDFTFPRNAAVVGSVFVNGSVTVTTPTNIDTSQMKLYLPSGESASYSWGGSFPYTTIDPAPTLTDLNTSYYENLLALAQAEPPAGNIWIWFDQSIGDTVLVNGNVTLSWFVDITTSGTSSIVVITGNLTALRYVTFSDSIQIIAGGGIYFDMNCSVGTTPGQSGNILYSHSGDITVSRTCVINGAILANNNLSLDRTSTVNGLIYVQNQADIARDLTISGCIWSNSFSGNTTEQQVSVNWNPSYLPDPLPPGVSEPGSTQAGASFVQNSWREL